MILPIIMYLDVSYAFASKRSLTRMCVFKVITQQICNKYATIYVTIMPVYVPAVFRTFWPKSVVFYTQVLNSYKIII